MEQIEDRGGMASQTKLCWKNWAWSERKPWSSLSQQVSNLSVEVLNQAEQAIIHFVQGQCFQEEIDILSHWK